MFKFRFFKPFQYEFSTKNNLYLVSHVRFLKFFLAITLVMSYFAEPNHIEYDAWFDENIDPIDLVDYLDEKEFSDSVHNKFHKISTRNLTIGSSNNFHW